MPDTIRDRSRGRARNRPLWRWLGSLPLAAVDAILAWDRARTVRRPGRQVRLISGARSAIILAEQDRAFPGTAPRGCARRRRRTAGGRRRTAAMTSAGPPGWRD